MRTRMAAAALLMTALAALAACKDDASGATGGSKPLPSSAEGTTTGLPHDGAPKVAEPIDAKPWTSKPCELITNEQLKAAGFTFPGMDFKVTDTSDPVTGPACDAQWGTSTKGLGFGLNLKTSNVEGLSSFYKDSKTPGKFDVFKELGDVHGYPAVEIEEKKSQLDPGDCNIEVGLRDDLPLQVIMSARQSKFSKDPCGAAKTVAGLVIDTMKKGS